MSGSAPTSSCVAENRPVPGGWLVVALLWVVGCLNYLDRILFTTMRDSIKAAIPMGDDQFGGLLTMFLVVYGLLSPLGGWCADRFSRSRVILVSLLVWSGVTLATAFAHSYQQLLWTRAVMGVSEACYIPAALALIADYHRGSTRSLATGVQMSGLYVGVSLGGMGGWMADRFGWSAGFTTFGGFGVAYAVLLAFLLRDVAATPSIEPRERPISAKASFWALQRSAGFWVLAVYWGLFSFTGWAFVTWMPTFLREHYHLSQGKAGFTATSYMYITAFLAVLGGGTWADRWSRTNLRGRLFVPIIALVGASPFIFMASRTEALWFTIVCLIIFGIARGCSDANTMPILCQIVDPPHRATGYGVLNCLGCLIGGIAAYLGGWLREHEVNVSVMLMSSALGVLVSGLLLLLIKPTRHS